MDFFFWMKVMDWNHGASLINVIIMTKFCINYRFMDRICYAKKLSQIEKEIDRKYEYESKSLVRLSHQTSFMCTDTHEWVVHTVFYAPNTYICQNDSDSFFYSKQHFLIQYDENFDNIMFSNTLNSSDAQISFIFAEKNLRLIHTYTN